MTMTPSKMYLKIRKDGFKSRRWDKIRNMAASTLAKSSCQVDAALNNNAKSAGSNSGDSDSGNSNSPTIYVKSGKPSSRLRQSQSASNLQVRAHSASGTSYSESCCQNRGDNMYPATSFLTLNSSSSAFPQNPPPTPQFSLYSTPGSGGSAPIPPPPPSLSSASHGVPTAHNPILRTLQKQHRGELSILEKYRYDLSRAQLKASSRTSALLAGFAMVALVELQYESTTPPALLIILGVVTTLLVSVHLLALMMSTCILPYIEANGCTQDSPHITLKFYIDLSWIFSTCIGLVLFLIEIGVIFFVKFNAVGYDYIGYITTAMLAPVLVVFIVFSCLIHRNRFSHSMDRVDSKVVDLQKFLTEADAHNLSSSSSVHKNIVGASLQGITVVKQK